MTPEHTHNGTRYTEWSHSDIHSILNGPILSTAKHSTKQCAFVLKEVADFNIE